MNMKNKYKLLSRVNQLNLRHMYIYLMCFNVLVTYIFGILSYTNLIFKKTKNPKNVAQNRVQYFDDEIYGYMEDNHYLVDIDMKNVKKNIVVILFTLLSILITCKLMKLKKNILMKYCKYKVKINMSIFNFMSKLHGVENHVYIMYCIVYRSVIFYTSEKAYNQVDFYNLMPSLVNQLVNVDTRFLYGFLPILFIVHEVHLNIQVDIRRNYITMKMLELMYFKDTLRSNNNVQKINNLPVMSIFLSQTLYLFSSENKNQVDIFSLGYIHCESVERYGIIQVLTRQLGKKSIIYICATKFGKLFFITTSDITESHIIHNTINVQQLYIGNVRTLHNKIYIYNPIIEYILNFVSSQLSYIVINFLKQLWVCLKIQTHMWYSHWVVKHVFHEVLITDRNPNEVNCTFRLVYIVMTSRKGIVSKCGIMIVKENGMYIKLFLCNFVKIYYDIEKYN